MNQGPVKKEALRRYLQSYEEAGVVSRTPGEAYSNAFLVKKPGHVAEGQDKMTDNTFIKQWRLILDLSTVNAKISSYATEPTTVASVLEQYDPQDLQCSVDILGTFHQVRLKGNPEVLNFQAAGHNYTHDKLPMGGVNSVNVLQAVLSSCFKELGKGVHPWFFTYVDDIILTSKTVEEMVDRLRQFLELCRKHNIKLKKSKSNLLRKDDISLLGFTVKEGKLRPAKDKLEKMSLALKEVKTQKDLRALLASLNYYRLFSPCFRYYAQPLFELLKLDKGKFKFSTTHLGNLEALMDEIRKTPGLSFLNDSKIRNGEYRIYADASNTAMGGLIAVRCTDKNGKTQEYPLAFHSRTFPDQYKLKHINILETLTLSMVMHKFKGYIQGTQCKLITDSQYVKRIMEMTGKKLYTVTDHRVT